MESALVKALRVALARAPPEQQQRLKIGLEVGNHITPQLLANIGYPVAPAAGQLGVGAGTGLAFGQTMCGFDILRADGQSYVCDVNGWASVKDSVKFWEDAAEMLRHHVVGQQQS